MFKASLAFTSCDVIDFLTTMETFFLQLASCLFGIISIQVDSDEKTKIASLQEHSLSGY